MLDAQRVVPITVIGDSQSLVYGDRVVVSAAGTPFVTRSIFCHLNAAELADADGTIDSGVLRGMRNAMLLVSDSAAPRIEAVHTGTSDLAGILRVAQDKTEIPTPALVLAAGHRDQQWFAWHTPYDDLVLPDDMEPDFALADVVRTTDDGAGSVFDSLTGLHERFMGLRYGLRALYAAGFTRLAVLSLAPMTPDDALWRRLRERMLLPPVREERMGVRFRYKVTLIVNHALRQICREEGVVFINRWNAQTRDGLAIPGLLQDDGIHIRSAFAEETVADIVAWAAS